MDNLLAHPVEYIRNIIYGLPRGGRQEELPHPPKPKARGRGQEEQPHLQGAVAARVQEGLEELFHAQGQKGRW